MAYCPEDGVWMNTVCLHYNACYDCPNCGLHWNYVDGTYEMGNAETALFTTIARLVNSKRNPTVIRGRIGPTPEREDCYGIS